MALDIASRVEAHEQREARRAELDRRDAEHGGLVSVVELVAEQAAKEQTDGWQHPYRPETSPADLTAARAGEEIDPHRRITEQRLLVDCRAAVRRYSRLHRFGGVKRPETIADVIATDAAILVWQWPQHGGGIDPRTGKRSPVVRLGGADALPLWRDWLTRAEEPQRGAPRWKLSDGAWSVLLAAVKQAARGVEVRAAATADKQEELTDPLDIAAAVEQRERDIGAETRLPDNAAPEVIAEYIGVTLDAARAIVARAYPAATPRDLTEAWGIGQATLDVSLSRGAAAVRERYPDPAKLLDDLDHAAERYRQSVAAEAMLALLALRDGDGDQEHAERIAADWRDCFGAMSPQRRALTIAAMRQHRRGGIDAERIAASVARLLPAEQRRGYIGADIGARGSFFGASRDTAGRMPARTAAARAAAAVLPAPRPMIGPDAWSGFGDGYSGACSIAGALKRWQLEQTSRSAQALPAGAD